VGSTASGSDDVLVTVESGGGGPTPSATAPQVTVGVSIAQTSCQKNGTCQATLKFTFTDPDGGQWPWEIALTKQGTTKQTSVRGDREVAGRGHNVDLAHEGRRL
jgi:hypothetical protein